MWNMSVAKSALHKAMRRGDVDTAAYAAAYLCAKGIYGQEAAWRRVLAFPAEDMCGEGVERVIALYHAWRDGHELDNLFAAIIYLCELAKRGLNRSADELKNAAFYWVDSGKEVKVPDYAYDVHTGVGTLREWWDDVNKLAQPSKWREDAMKYKPPQKDKEGQQRLL